MTEKNTLELLEFVTEFANAKIEALRWPGIHSIDEEPDPTVDAVEVWEWQSAAREILAKCSQ